MRKQNVPSVIAMIILLAWGFVNYFILGKKSLLLLFVLILLTIVVIVAIISIIKSRTGNTRYEQENSDLTDFVKSHENDIINNKNEIDDLIRQEIKKDDQYLK